MIVGQLHQMIGSQLQIAAQRTQGQRDIFVFHHIVQAIGTEEHDVAGANIEITDLDIDRRLDPQRPRDQVPVVGVARLFGRNHATIDLLL
jgi:hypothetical protein